MRVLKDKPSNFFLFQAEIEKFRKFADKVEELHVENNKVAMDLDDAPDEFKGKREVFISRSQGCREPAPAPDGFCTYWKCS